MSVSNPIRITLDIPEFKDISFQVLSTEVDMRISAPFNVKVTVAQKVTPSTVVFFDDLRDGISKNLKATLNIDYQNNDTVFTVSGAISGVSTTNAAGGILDLAVIEIKPEWDQYYNDKVTGVYYYGQADKIVKTLYDTINATEYSKFTQTKHNFVTSDETLYPEHPIYTRYEESTLAFYDRILAEHGLWYLWIPVKANNPDSSDNTTKDNLELAVFDNWESFDKYVSKMDDLDQDLYDQSLTLAQTTAGLESVFEQSISTPQYSGHPTDVEAEHKSLYSFSLKHQEHVKQQAEAKTNNKPAPEEQDDLWASAVSKESAVVPKTVEFVHYNPEAPEVLIRSKYNSSYKKAFGLQQFKTSFNTLNQDQLDAHLKVKVKNIEYKQATSVVGHYGGKILLPGTKLTLKTERKFGFKADSYRVSQVHLLYRSELLTPAMNTLGNIAQSVSSDQIDKFHLAKNYVEDHAFIAVDAEAEYGTDIPKLEKINQISGVYPYRDMNNKYDTIEPNLAGSVKVKFPYDFETTFNDNPDNRYYCPKLSDYNSKNANHSAPYYSMTELLVAYIGGNINKPIIKGALSHRDTSSLDTSNHFERNYKHFDQGSSIAFTSDVGSDMGNSMLLKAEHSDFNEVSHISVNNVASTKVEGDNHLDQIVTTSANKTKVVKGESEESYGIDPTGNTDIPNQYKLVKPAREINELIDPIQGTLSNIVEQSAPAPLFNKPMPEQQDVDEENQRQEEEYLKKGVPSVKIQMDSPPLTATGYANGFNITATGTIQATATVTLKDTLVQESTMTINKKVSLQQEAKAKLGQAFMGLSIMGGAIGKNITDPELTVGCRMGEFELTVSNIVYVQTGTIRTFKADASLSNNSFNTSIDDASILGNASFNFNITGIQGSPPKIQTASPVVVPANSWYEMALVEAIRIFEPMPLKISRNINDINLTDEDKSAILQSLVATMLAVGFSVKFILGV